MASIFKYFKEQCSLNYKLAWKAKKASSHSSNIKAKKKKEKILFKCTT